MVTRSTDWKAYYEKRSIFSKISGGLCEMSLQKILCGTNFVASGKIDSIVELGGGNSIIYPWLRKHYPHANITLIDRESFSERSFLAAAENDSRLRCVRHDILKSRPDTLEGTGDLVLSLGLIEHFEPNETRKMVERHFSYCKPGGVILISFPCPTILYRCTRRIMELMGVWQFHDERPLLLGEVRPIMEQYGEEICRKLDHRMGLTQQILVYRKRGIGA